MNYIKLLSVSLVFALMLTITSCSLFKDNPEPDFYDVYVPGEETGDDLETVDPLDLLLSPDDTGIPSVYSDEINVLGDNLQIYDCNDDFCSIVYNESGAWMFDQKAIKVTPLVDLEAMIADADPTGRGTEYFKDVTISYDFVERDGVEIRIEFTVTSNTADAYFKVYGHYTLFEENEYLIEDYKRGDFRGYYIEETVYPGSDEPIGIYDISDYARLGIYKDNWLFKMATAIVENDVHALESMNFLEEGTLSDWEGMVISEYEIIRDNPTSPYLDFLTLNITIAESNVERYPAGEYVIEIAEGPDLTIDIKPASEVGTDYVLTEAAQWLAPLAEHFGGFVTANADSPSHSLTDLYLYHTRVVGTEPSYDEFVRFSEDCFGIKINSGDVSRAEIESHGGHGFGTSLCEISGGIPEDGVCHVTVTYFADPMKSVIATVDEYELVKIGDGICKYEIKSAERTYDTDLKICGWSV